MRHIAYAGAQLRYVRLDLSTRVEIAIQIAQLDVQILQLGKQLTLVCPHVQLTHQLRHNEERAPTAYLLRFEYVPEYVIAHIEHILALGIDELGEQLARPARVHLTRLQWTNVRADLQATRLRVHLTQHGALVEEQRFACIHHNHIEVTLPVAMRLVCVGAMRKVKEISHNLVGVRVVTVGQHE